MGRWTLTRRSAATSKCRLLNMRVALKRNAFRATTPLFPLRIIALAPSLTGSKYFILNVCAKCCTSKAYLVLLSPCLTRLNNRHKIFAYWCEWRANSRLFSRIVLRVTVIGPFTPRLFCKKWMYYGQELVLSYWYWNDLWYAINHLIN